MLNRKRRSLDDTGSSTQSRYNKTMSVEPIKPKSKRRWFQFSLRTLLIVTAIFAALFAWWSHKARQQREMVKAISRSGGDVQYDFHRSAAKGPVNWPQWIVDMLGVDYFASVWRISLIGPEFTDANLEPLDRDTAFQELLLSHSQITDSGLQRLHGSQALQSLSLESTRVGDDGLKRIEGLTTLKALGLRRTVITDDGLRHLKALTDLKDLSLDNTEVTDVGLDHLRGLTALQWLNLSHTKVTDAGVKRLQEALPKCKILR